jgi:hypothetical protein
VSVYLVRLQAAAVRATLESEEREYSFLKNEYVWATSASEAIEKARANVRDALRRKPSVRQEEIESLPLIVDEVRDGQGLLNLIKSQGFVFCATEEKTKVNDDAS